MAKDREIYTIGIVLLGNFNPVILTPFWLSSKGLIRETEAETAKVDIIHPDISRFEIDWLSVETTPNRIHFKTNRESHFLALKDLIISIFSHIKETPINAIGINHLCHFSLNDFKEYEKFGYWLSPVQEFGELLNNPKVLSVQYVETLKEKTDGVIRITISPSDLILDKKSLVFNFNHHFENPNMTDAKSIMSLLNDKWDFSFKKVDQLNNLIWDKAKY